MPPPFSAAILLGYYFGVGVAEASDFTSVPSLCAVFVWFVWFWCALARAVGMLFVGLERQESAINTHGRWHGVLVPFFRSKVRSPSMNDGALHFAVGKGRQERP